MSQPPYGWSLQVTASTKVPRVEKGKRFHRIERSYGTFARSFTTPEEVAEDKLKAEFKDGMLFVHLPKAERPKPKAVEIKVD